MYIRSHFCSSNFSKMAAAQLVREKVTYLQTLASADVPECELKESLSASVKEITSHISALVTMHTAEGTEIINMLSTSLFTGSQRQEIARLVNASVQSHMQHPQPALGAVRKAQGMPPAAQAGLPGLQIFPPRTPQLSRTSATSSEHGSSSTPSTPVLSLPQPSIPAICDGDSKPNLEGGPSDSPENPPPQSQNPPSQSPGIVAATSALLGILRKKPAAKPKKGKSTHTTDAPTHTPMKGKSTEPMKGKSSHTPMKGTSTKPMKGKSSHMKAFPPCPPTRKSPPIEFGDFRICVDMPSQAFRLKRNNHPDRCCSFKCDKKRAWDKVRDIIASS